MAPSSVFGNFNRFNSPFLNRTQGIFQQTETTKHLANLLTWQRNSIVYGKALMRMSNRPWVDCVLYWRFYRQQWLQRFSYFQHHCWYLKFKKLLGVLKKNLKYFTNTHTIGSYLLFLKRWILFKNITAWFFKT